nr:hypothetical protein [Gemmatimonadaceae bacterium]
MTITAPADGFKSKKADVAVTGTVSDATAKEVTLTIGGNDSKVAVTDRQFSTTATLAQGDNLIQASVGSSESNALPSRSAKGRRPGMENGWAKFTA